MPKYAAKLILTTAKTVITTKTYNYVGKNSAEFITARDEDAAYEKLDSQLENNDDIPSCWVLEDQEYDEDIESDYSIEVEDYEQ